MIIVCILKICLLILLLFTEILAFHTGLVSWLTDILPTFHVDWLLIQYFLLVTIIQTDFADVNRAIQSLIRINTLDFRLQSFYQMRRIVVNNSIVHQLLQLQDVHCHLCEISEDVSSFYSLPVLFGIVFLFLTLVYNGYYLLLPLLMIDILEYETLSNTIVWIIFLIYPISLLTNRITRILIEMKKTGNIVHNLLNCTIGKETKAELKFSLQLLHRKIQFTANGYFTLDNTFLYSLIGTVITYLVILVQFQMGSSRSSDSNVTIQGKI
ncbi:PREDICTED: putative gustatory receptor 28a [Atta colombica]|uniref:putative gustatory receptor 28a n=1 Tax=Atta colombica TaxID=520822 RepID=UPI00084C3637|nr:PREDICTED: putative gustatory receptor 28a [Atta colombica]